MLITPRNLVSLPVFVFWTAALNAQIPPDNDDGTEADDDVEVIVVTTQKREQKSLDVPVSVGVLTGAFLEKQGIFDLDDASEFITGFQLQLQQVNTPSFVIRGITSDVSDPESEPNISVFFDGIPGSRASGSVIELFDLERIEVAKGPQGTLYSRGASNGAINFIFRKPEDDLYAELAATYGNYNNRRIEAIANTPLIDDTLFLRLGAVYHEREGFVDNPSEDDGRLNGKDTLHLRASAKLDLTEELAWTLLSYFQVDTPDQTAFLTAVPALARIDPLNDYADDSARSPVDAFGSTANDPRVVLRRRVTGFTNLLEYDIDDDWQVSSSTGYRRFESDDSFDIDGTSLDLVFAEEGDDGELIFQELRFTYEPLSRFSAFGGASFYRETASRSTTFVLDQAGLFDTVFPLLTGSRLPVPTSGLPQTTEQMRTTSTTTSFSAFVDGTVEILKDRLSITGGARITRDDKTFATRSPSADPASAITLASSDLASLGAAASGDAEALVRFIDSLPRNDFSPGNTVLSNGADGLLDLLGVPAALLPPNLESNSIDGTTGGTTLATSEPFTYVEPRALIQWHPVEGLNTYASYSIGIRSGGLDINPRRGTEENQYRRVIDEERVTSYEIGVKGQYDFGAVALRGEAAAYHYDYDDFQTLVVVDGSIRTVNAGEASADGFESSLNLDFDSGFDIFGNVSYVDGGIDNGATAGLLGGTQDLSGKRFRLTPDVSTSAGVSYTQELTEQLTGTISLLGSYRSRVFFNAENETATSIVPIDFSQDGFPLFWLNASVRWAQRYGLSLRVENLLDQDYLIDAGNTGRLFGLPTTIRGQPRFYSITVDVRL